MNETNSDPRLIPIAIIVAGLIIAGAIYFGGSKNTNNVNLTGQPEATNTTGIVAPITDKDHILGSKDAPIVIVEYSDFECPWCKVFHQTMHEIRNIYGDKVAWVYRQSPIIGLHPKAPKESEASECAAEQGGNEAFWKFADKIFSVTPSNNGLDLAQLPVIAGEIGLDVQAFNACLSSGKFTKQVEEGISAAIKAGSQGATPYSVIMTKDGKKVAINGAQPIENVKAQIDALLK